MKCKTCKKREGRGKKNICRYCWRADYTEKNLAKITKQQTDNYIKHRETRLQQSKDWAKRNPQRVREYGLIRWHEHSKLNKIRQLTKARYTDLKKTNPCQNCGSMEKLEFHHLEPISPENFVILCFNCHRMLHKQLLPQFVKVKSLALFESKNEGEQK